MTDLSLAELIPALRSGRRSPAEYLSELERRFAEVEPRVLAFMPEPGRFDRLRREAAALEARFPDPTSRPTLFGVPVGVKDIFHVDGFPTTGGSRLPPEVLRGPQAESVTRLIEAGALILGKTVSTEFAYFAPGPTRNPRSPAGKTHTPGGSSSGSAAAVAAGLAPLTLGTQTIGSILRPASFCGIVGFKPTYDRVSRAGVIPLAPSLDHVGPFATDVTGVALAASVLIRDWRTAVEVERRPVLAIPEGPYLERASGEMLAHFRRICGQLQEAGYTLKPVTILADIAALLERHYTLTAGEAARVHADWYARFGDLYHPRTRALIERGRAVPDPVLAELRGGCRQLRQTLHEIMARQGIDVWVAPAAVGPALEGLESTGDPIMNLPWTHAGLPALSLPAGELDGLPVGLQLVGRFGADEELLAWATKIEDVIRTAKTQSSQSA
jgi:Asp-tRNA(Asn)/Glu-tRNA(Gln) amidotransferase A subunit family amidase